MTLAGKTVQFWLSLAGKTELPEPLSGGETLEALVIEEDRLGVWIWVANEVSQPSQDVPEVMLLKWEHFCTALTGYEVPQPPGRPAAGFRA